MEPEQDGMLSCMRPGIGMLVCVMVLVVVVVLADACRVGYFRSLTLVCYYLRVSRNHNIVLLLELKGAPGVVDGDRMLGKNGIYDRVWEVGLEGGCKSW